MEFLVLEQEKNRKYMLVAGVIEAILVAIILKCHTSGDKVGLKEAISF